MTATDDDLCGALYLTQPGPLWPYPDAGSTAAALAFTDVRPRQRAHASKELATHAPDLPYASAHRVHAVWGQWVPGYRPVAQPYTPAQRDRVRPAYTRYLQGQAGGPDKVLDAYLKTVPAPTAAEVVRARTTATGAKAHALAAADAMPPPLHPLTRAASSSATRGPRLGGPFRDHAATAAGAPLAVAMAARRGRSLAPAAVRAEARRVRRARMPAPAVHTRAVPPPLHVGFCVQPNRFAGVTAARPPLTSVVTHPWAVTAYAVGRLERHLLDRLHTASHTHPGGGGPPNASAQRQEVKRRVQWVRTTLRRLRELVDWQAACAPGTDLLQPRKVGGASTSGDAPPCPTPSQWRRGLLAQFDRLCPQTATAADAAGVWADALDTLDATWWYGGGRHAAFVAATTVAPADAPLLAHMARPPPHQLNDAARRAYVSQQRPQATDADRAALVQAGEWHARFVLASDAARRKELTLPSWTLTYAAGTLAATTPAVARRRSASSRRTRRASSASAAHSSAAPTSSASPRRRRRRSGRQRRPSPPTPAPPPPSPKKSGGGAASSLSSSSSPSSAPSHHTRPVRMDTPLSLTQDISVSRASADLASNKTAGGSGGDDSASSSKTAGGGASTTTSKKSGGGARTIVLDTRVSGTTTASLGKTAGKGASKGGKKGRTSNSHTTTTKPLVTVTKQGDKSKTPKHRLTEAEVGAYRKGLHKHVKANGGRAYVEAQQAEQQRKAPAFDFVQLFPKDSPFLKTIPGKLRKSARNRNALRRVKREVLRTYGYHKSATYKRCSGGGGGAASKDPLVGGGGASRRRSSPRLQDGQSGGSKDGYTGALYTRKHRPGGGESGAAAHEAGGGGGAPRVSWVDTLSTGEPLADTSAADMETTQGLSALDLGGLESVVVG